MKLLRLIILLLSTAFLSACITVSGSIPVTLPDGTVAMAEGRATAFLRPLRQVKVDAPRNDDSEQPVKVRIYYGDQLTPGELMNLGARLAPIPGTN